MRNPALACTAVASLALIAAAAVVSVRPAAAGPLNPPAGPVAPTYKTLQQVEPRTDVATLPSGGQAHHRITQPGSYYLTGNVTAQAGELHAVSVESDDVTLDLNGFAVGTVVPASATGAGVFVNGARSRVTIRNGSISGFLACIGAEDDDCVRVENVTTGVANFGIFVGTNAVVTACQVQPGTTSGIDVGAGSVVTDCTVRGVAQAAFRLGGGSRARGCVARASAQGFVLADGAAAVGCSAYECTTGFVAANNAEMLDCVARGGSFGIDMTGGGNRVERCKIGNATTGIRCGFATTITGNTLNAAASVSGEGIILLGQDNHVQDNHIYTFSTGVTVSATFNVVIRNYFHFVNAPVAGTGAAGSLIAATVTTAAGLASNPTANIQQ